MVTRLSACQEKANGDWLTLDAQVGDKVKSLTRKKKGRKEGARNGSASGPRDGDSRKHSAWIQLHVRP